MEAVQRKVLEKSRVFLVKNVMPDVLWPYLVEEGVFTDDMLEEIQVAQVNATKVMKLLRMLSKRGPKAYGKFCYCLSQTDQGHIVEELDKVETTLRNAAQTENRPHMNVGMDLVDEPNRPIKRSHSHNGQLQASYKKPKSSSPVSPPPHVQPEPTPPHVQTRSQSRAAHDTPAGKPRVTHHRKVVTLTPVPGVSTVGITSSGHVWKPSDGPVPAVDPIQSGSGSSPPRRATNVNAVTATQRSPQGRAGTSVDVRPAGAYGTPPGRPLTHSGRPLMADNGDLSDEQDVSNPFGLANTMGRLKIEFSDSSSMVFDPNVMYPMRSDPRGYCLVINNRDFNGHLKERLGSDVDCDNLHRLFSKLGYLTDCKENLNAMDMLVTLRDFARLTVHRDVDSAVVVILTHGVDGFIYGSDCQLVNLSEVFSFFDGALCPALSGKPKFFVVQSCRGDKYDGGFDFPDTGDTGGPDSHTSFLSDALVTMQQEQAADVQNLRKKLPSCSDFLIAYATIPGFVSWRNSEQGSWFVQALCQVFRANAHKEDAMSMLVQTNDLVATVFQSATQHKQMPAPVCHLRKKLCFFPTVSTRTPVSVSAQDQEEDQSQGEITAV